MTLEHEYQLSEIERQKLSKESANLRHQLKQLEADRKSLADEYIKLKTGYMSLTDDIQREVRLTTMEFWQYLCQFYFTSHLGLYMKIYTQ